MKTTKLLLKLMVFVLFSCSSVSVNSDYDKTVDFNKYKTYAYYKEGIDKVEISDLDKKRILNAIDTQMQTKGFTKSDDPDLLINFFTKTKEQVSVNQFNSGWGYGWGWGWNPYMMGGQTTVSSSTEGTLFIDFIDSKKKELVWQGQGVGNLPKNMDQKDKIINEFVSQIIEKYPPIIKK